MVLGVRLQVLGELPDARRRERDLDFGRARVLLSSPVIGDQLALDFSLFCQTEVELYRPFDYRPLGHELDRPIRAWIRTRPPRPRAVDHDRLRVAQGVMP